VSNPFYGKNYTKYNLIVRIGWNFGKYYLKNKTKTMKNSFQTIMVIGLVSIVSAVSAASITTKTESEKAINDAYRARFTSSFVNPGKHISKTYQEKRSSLYLKMKENNITNKSLNVIRHGAFKFSSFYEKRRSTTKANYYRPNYNQVTKARALDYYKNGGSASTKGLRNDLVFGSTHQIPRNVKMAGSAAASGKDIVKIRNIQKIFMKGFSSGNSQKRKPFSQQKITNRFSNPYIKNLYSF